MPTIITTDPICGMLLEPEGATITCTYAGWTYLFCCEECLTLFQRSPATCVAYLAHSRTAHVGHPCQYQRASSQPSSTGVSL